MGWFYFMEETLVFNFKATALLKKLDGIPENKEVKITGLASDELGGFTGKDINLEMENGEYLYPIAYSKLSNI